MANYLYTLKNFEYNFNSLINYSVIDFRFIEIKNDYLIEFVNNCDSFNYFSVKIVEVVLH